MLDERLLRQEHHDMDIYSAREEGIELGMERGIAQEKRHMVRAMLSKGIEHALICDIAGITDSELQAILADKNSLG